MAIKVNGTTVINDSRVLSNIASVDATSAAAIFAAGGGGSGSGLDADLLDGQQGTYYYSPANPPPLPITDQAVLSVSGGAATAFNPQDATITVSNYSSYTDPVFTYTLIKQSTNETIESGTFTGSTKIFPYTLNTFGLLTLQVYASEQGKLPAPVATASFTLLFDMTFRYYRVSNVIGIIGTSTNGGIAEWRLYSGPERTGTDLAPVSITESYSYSSTYNGPKARDGSLSSMWWTLASTQPQWLMYDMGASPPSVASMRLDAYNNGSYGFTNGVLEASDTGAFSGEQTILVADVDLQTFLNYG